MKVQPRQHQDHLSYYTKGSWYHLVVLILSALLSNKLDGGHKKGTGAGCSGPARHEIQKIRDRFYDFVS